MPILVAILVPACFVLFFTLPAITSAAPLVDSNRPWNVNRNAAADGPADYYGEWPDHVYTPSPEDWRDTTWYHVKTDRFFDGDPRNNEGRYHGYNPRSIYERHGGDFVGLTSRLDYIQALGINTLWISPIFQGGKNNYHGYAQIDFTLLDDRLGTLEEFRTLVTEAHKRGIYVVVDIVVNHLADQFYFEGYRNSEAPFKLHVGEYRLFPRLDGFQYDDFIVVNDFDPDGGYCDVFDMNGRRHRSTGSGTFTRSDFHHNGTLKNFLDPWAIHLGKLYNAMDDLRLGETRVMHKLAAMSKSLIASTDIDGFRIDTPMQVPRCFFEFWIPEVRRFARQIGKENFGFFGEFYATPAWTATVLGRGIEQHANGPASFIGDDRLFDGGIDYLFYKSYIHPVLHKPQRGLGQRAKEVIDFQHLHYDLVSKESFAALQDENIEAQDQMAHGSILEEHRASGKTRYQMLHFFNSHDQPRLCSYNSGVQKSKLAMALITLLPGIPVHYYGDEQGLCSYGSALSGYGREAMMSSVAWFDHPSPNPENPASKDNFDMTSDLFRYLARLNELRNSLQALRRSDELTVLYNKELGDGTVVAFSRSYLNEPPIVVLYNSSSRDVSSVQVDVTDLFPLTPLKLVDVLNGKNRSVRDGKLYVEQIAAYDVHVYSPAAALSASRTRVIDVEPAHDSFLTELPSAIVIRFDATLSVEDVAPCISLNGRVSKNFILKQLADDAVQLTLTEKLGHGVHVLRVADSSSCRHPEVLPFVSRFTVGDQAHPLRFFGEIRRDPTLVNNGQSRSRQRAVVLHHKSDGAEFFRVSVDDGWSYSDWQPYSSQTDFTFSKHQSDWSEVLIQYYIPGSTAHYVRGGIHLDLGDGHPAGMPPSLSHFEDSDSLHLTGQFAAEN